MSRRTVDRRPSGSTFTVLWLSGIAGHEIGDYLVQLDRDAVRKQERTPAGRRSLVRHVITYSLMQLTAKWAATRFTGEKVSPRALIAGQLVELALHAAIDDGRALLGYANLMHKRRFHDQVSDGINGRALLDQACHRGMQIPAGAVVTAWLDQRDREA